MKVTKPVHNRYALHFLDNGTYIKYATTYAGCKPWRVRRVYSFLGGTGLWRVAKEVAVITNSTRVLKSYKLVYTSVGYVIEACEDASHVPFLPLYFAFFGQPIPANKEGRFSSWSNIPDIVDNLR